MTSTMNMTGMSMGGMSMSSSAASASNTSSHMDMDDDDMMSSMTCSMNMLGNWDTIGSCFLTSSWMIKTSAQFAGTCIGVFLIVVLIEAIRRWGREFDRYIIRRAQSQRCAANRARKVESNGTLADDKTAHAAEAQQSSAPPPPRGAFVLEGLEQVFYGRSRRAAGGTAPQPQYFRPSVLQQAVRSLVYAIQFTAAYIVMLIAMSYNGYILISIMLGALVGHFFSTWDNLTMVLTEDDDGSDPYVLISGGGAQTSGLNSAKAGGALPDVASGAYGHGSGVCCT